MKNILLFILFASSAAMAIPASTGPLMQATTSHVDFQDIIKGNSSPFAASLFDSLLVERVFSKDIGRSIWTKCTGGSRSGSVLRVTLQGTSNSTFYFGTRGNPSDLELCGN